MVEKVSCAHPDKIADRIAGAIVDLAYTKSKSPRVAVEALIGHGECHVIIETSEDISYAEVRTIVDRILGTDTILTVKVVPQDEHLAKNQRGQMRCGDNGIFKGTPLTKEEKRISRIAHKLYDTYGTDGKYILNKDQLIICQSCANIGDIRKLLKGEKLKMTINPLGHWEGGLGVDSGAVNRKLGSDMGQAVTGGGLHGKDLSKADVSVNIYAHLKAQEIGKSVELYCAIGDEFVDGKPYAEIVKIAKEYIENIGGFEKFAEWGLF